MLPLMSVTRFSDLGPLSVRALNRRLTAARDVMAGPRTLETLYSTLCKADVELLRSIRELDEELECGRISLSEILRPQLSFAPRHSKSINIFMVLTHMNYVVVSRFWL